MQSPNEIVTSSVFYGGGFFLLTCFLSYIGDDEVAYKILKRKPTPKEGMARIRFVLVKLLSCLYGGSALSYFLVQKILKERLGFSFSGNESIALILVSMGFVFLFIGAVQNLIRILLGRPRRPILDFSLLKHNLSRWGDCLRR